MHSFNAPLEMVSARQAAPPLTSPRLGAIGRTTHRSVALPKVLESAQKMSVDDQN
jgi:hypothetical protein